MFASSLKRSSRIESMVRAERLRRSASAKSPLETSDTQSGLVSRPPETCPIPTASRKLELAEMVVCGVFGASIAPGLAPLAQAERPSARTNSARGAKLRVKADPRNAISCLPGRKCLMRNVSFPARRGNRAAGMSGVCQGIPLCSRQSSRPAP